MSLNPPPFKMPPIDRLTGLFSQPWSAFFRDLQKLVGTGGGGGGGGPVSASDVSFSPTGSITSTDVQSAISEVVGDASSALSAHVSDTSGAHEASAISNSPSGNIASTNVQAALDEIQSDVDTRAVLPTQSGNAGKFLQTDGSATSWEEPSILGITSDSTDGIGIVTADQQGLPINIFSGSNSGGSPLPDTGDINIGTGAASGGSGASTGSISFTTGTSLAGSNSGNINFTTGPGNGSVIGGFITFTAGSGATSANRGGIDFVSGSGSAIGRAGGIGFSSGRGDLTLGGQTADPRILLTDGVENVLEVINSGQATFKTQSSRDIIFQPGRDFNCNPTRNVVLNPDSGVIDCASAQIQNASYAYAPGNSGDWSGTEPATVEEALDRIATLLASLNGGIGP